MKIVINRGGEGAALPIIGHVVSLRIPDWRRGALPREALENRAAAAV